VAKKKSGSDKRIRDKMVPLRATEREKDALMAAAQQRGQSVSDMMREAVFAEIGYSAAV
jgi:uncharacterized protein (DUF1778 family)